MSLPYLRDNGWEAHVLAIDPRFVESALDFELLQTVPADVPVTRVGAIPLSITKWLGLGNLGLRAFVHLGRGGNRHLIGGGFDLVYFSTTVFPVMSLGPKWKKRFGVPYVLDLQDPWVSDYYDRTGVMPPGGRWKYRFSQWSARRSEPIAVRGAAHIISVSPAYPKTLMARYPDLMPERFTVLPFGAPEADAEFVRQRSFPNRQYDVADGCRHWVYLGRGGPDMATALRGLFTALRALRRQRSEVDNLRLLFVGTSYANDGRAELTIEPIAKECGVADLVTERTERIPYLEGLALLKASDGILIIGSDDPGYSASKVYPCIMMKRPLLAILHEASLAGEVIRTCRAGEVVDFKAEVTNEELARRIVPALQRLLDWPRDVLPNTNWTEFAQYTARAMTTRQCAIFDQAVASNNT